MVTQAQNFQDGLENQPAANLYLLEFYEIGSTEIARYVLNNEDITSQGNLYEKGNIKFSLPSSNADNQNITMTVPNIDLTAGRKAFFAKKRLQCRMILASGQNVDEWIFDSKDLFVFQVARIDGVSVTGQLGLKADPLMPYSFGKTGKESFPGLFF